MDWLAVDIGNSTVGFGYFLDSDLEYKWSVPMKVPIDMSYYERAVTDRLIDQQVDIKGLQPIVSCVVPELLVPVLEMLEWLTGHSPLTVQFDLYPLIKLEIDHPLELGTDLFVNAVAAHHLYPGKNIIVDFGTALTFTLVDQDGELKGVSIAPGLETAVRSLYEGTAQLPEVPLNLPESVIGKNTADSIQSGVLFGYVGMVSHLITSVRHEFGLDYRAIGTGGLSQVLKPLENHFEIIDLDLTLKGLQIYASQVIKN